MYAFVGAYKYPLFAAFFNLHECVSVRFFRLIHQSGRHTRQYRKTVVRSHLYDALHQNDRQIKSDVNRMSGKENERQTQRKRIHRTQKREYSLERTKKLAQPTRRNQVFVWNARPFELNVKRSSQ